MTLDRGSSIPLWRQVLDDLRRRLDAGDLVEGFPTDHQLMEHYGVSRHTAREAVRRLQAEGIITRHRGRGTFLADGTIEQATGAIYSLYRSIAERGLSQRSKVLDLSTVTDPSIADRLGLRPNAKLVRLERLRFADDEPLAHDTAWLPASIARPLLRVDFSYTALYDELARRSGVRPTSGTEWISTEMPDQAERDLLGIGPQTPVFHICRAGFAGDRPIEWRHTFVRGDRYSFVANWSPSGGYETVMAPVTDPG